MFQNERIFTVPTIRILKNDPLELNILALKEILHYKNEKNLYTKKLKTILDYYNLKFCGKIKNQPNNSQQLLIFSQQKFMFMFKFLLRVVFVFCKLQLHGMWDGSSFCMCSS